MFKTIFRDYWDVFTLALFVAWHASKITSRMKNLESQPQTVTVASCEEIRRVYRAHIESELNHGNREFAEVKGVIIEVKRMIGEVDRKNEERHTMIIKQLLAQSKDKE